MQLAPINSWSLYFGQLETTTRAAAFLNIKRSLYWTTGNKEGREAPPLFNFKNCIKQWFFFRQLETTTAAKWPRWVIDENIYGREAAAYLFDNWELLPRILHKIIHYVSIYLFPKSKLLPNLRRMFTTDVLGTNRIQGTSFVAEPAENQNLPKIKNGFSSCNK